MPLADYRLLDIGFEASLSLLLVGFPAKTAFKGSTVLLWAMQLHSSECRARRVADLCKVLHFGSGLSKDRWQQGLKGTGRVYTA